MLADFFTDPENILKIVTQMAIVFFGTYTGAFLAFYFNRCLHERKKREENLTYLQFAIGRLVALTSNLYLFKKDIILRRSKEAQDIEQKMYIAQQTKQQALHLSIEELWKKMYGGKYDWPIVMEKLSFIAIRDPNIVTLMGTAANSVGTFQDITTSINDLLDEDRQSHSFNGGDVEKPMDQSGISRLELLISLIKILHEQVDSSLYLVEKSTDLLIKAGKDIFGSKMDIRSANFKYAERHGLKPAPIESWENTNWLPKKKTPFTAFLEKIRGQKAASQKDNAPAHTPNTP